MYLCTSEDIYTQSTPLIPHSFPDNCSEKSRKRCRLHEFFKKLFSVKKQFNDIANKACLKCKQGLVATQLSLSYNSIKCVSI